MADIDDEESSGDEESSQDEEEGAEEMDGMPTDEVTIEGMPGEEDMSGGMQLDQDVPRLQDMHHLAITPTRTPNFNLFPNRYEYLMPPPIVPTESMTKCPYVVLLILGILLMLLSLIN